LVGKREYPDHPVVGVGGVVILDGRALLIRRGSEPLKGQWSIPGGTLELGETLQDGVRRELREETGLDVRVLELIEVFERIFLGSHANSSAPSPAPARPQYHFVIVDYLCEAITGSPCAGSDVTDVALAAEEDLSTFNLTPAATRVIRKAFSLARSRTQPDL
jgi:8-oxo-dGTP diphosphatase